MKIIGLTGGIASGKSTVAAVLRSLGAKIFDADAASRQAVARGSGAAAGHSCFWCGLSDG